MQKALKAASFHTQEEEKTDMVARLLLIPILMGLFSVSGKAMDLSFSLGPESSMTDVSQMTFVAPPGHHFNAQAPSLVKTLYKKKMVRAKSIKFEGRKAIATWDNRIDKCHMDAVLYICDDKNSYCLPQKQSFTCKGFNVVVSEWVPTVTEEMAKDGAQKGESDESKVFLENMPDKALQLAKEKHRPLLIDFYGIWCPPCNQLDETVFKSKVFLDMKSQYVFLKLDADSPTSWALKSKYRITGYPTVVLAAENGDEITRIVGTREPSAFVAEMKKVLKDQTGSFDEKKKKADLSQDPKASYDVGVIYLNRQEFGQAHYYLLKASRSWDSKDPKRNQLLSAALGLHSQAQDESDLRAYAKLLETSLEWYPHNVEALDRSVSLARAAKDLEDKELEAKAYQLQVKTVQWFLDHPKTLEGQEYSLADLHEVLGEAYEGLKEPERSKKAFEKAAEEYGKSIKAAGLDESSERGYNLERIYCLWKAGKTDVAKGMYENLEKVYPNEFTFFYQHANLLKELDQKKEALDKALNALAFSYGDNRLRVVNLIAELYGELGEKKKALNLLDETLSQSKLPDDRSIRTHRYYDKLKKLRQKISES